MHTENYSELLDSVAGALEKDLKVKKGFFKAIVVGDDWSFVIKLNALFEA